MHFELSVERLFLPRLAALSLVLLLVPTAESAGQAEWQRTVEVIVPVEEELVTRPLTDSIVAMIEAQALSPKRTPQSDTTATLEEIEASLSGEGLALTSATHVFITYRFTQSNGRLRRRILDLHFIYRPSAEQGEDIPILYLDLSEDDLHQQLLTTRLLGAPGRGDGRADRRSDCSGCRGGRRCKAAGPPYASNPHVRVTAPANPETARLLPAASTGTLFRVESAEYPSPWSTVWIYANDARGPDRLERASAPADPGAGQLFADGARR
ncbi:MAG: hypothetical protein BRD43_01290 [Bacteroidetes bacterium QS_4_64_154]|nr:MAG: hypothetical protein BRD43_01290 [Bacteroidetes bacterium QS_4_64_154]